MMTSSFHSNSVGLPRYDILSIDCVIWHVYYTNMVLTISSFFSLSMWQDLFHNIIVDVVVVILSFGDLDSYYSSPWHIQKQSLEIWYYKKWEPKPVWNNNTELNCLHSDGISFEVPHFQFWAVINTYMNLVKITSHLNKRRLMHFFFPMWLAPFENCIWGWRWRGQTSSTIKKLCPMGHGGTLLWVCLCCYSWHELFSRSLSSS